MRCDHSFVTYVGGDEPYECGDCGVLLAAVPTAGPKTALKIPSVIRQAFMDGMITLGEAAESLSVTMKQFAETVRDTFVETPIYNDIHEVGHSGPVARIIIDVDPARTSCPLEVDSFFSGNPPVNGIGNKFPDISVIGHNRECESGFDMPQAHYFLDFIDGSIQKVIS